MSVTPSEVDITAGSGTHVSTVDITNGGNTDKRQVMAVGGPNTGDLSVIANVAAASTGAALADPGLVVSLSPNTSATSVSSTALETGHVLKASAGVLHGFSGYNSRTSQQFIQVFNSTTVPADATVPIIVMLVPPQSNFYWDSVKFGVPFSTGISISNSSTVATKTIGSADCFFFAQIT
jgi:hypothetical protein